MKHFKFFFSLLKSELHPSQQNREFTEFEALIDLICRGEKLMGMIETTSNELAKAWQWDRSRVSRFIDRLDGNFVTKGKPGKRLTIIYINDRERLYGLPTHPELKADEVMKLFNKIMNKEHEASPARITLIAARIKEGHDMPQFEAVFKFKKKEWENDENYSKYLTVDTLCRPTKFQKYLDAAREDYKKSKASGKFVQQRNYTN